MIFNTIGIDTYGTTLVPVPVVSATQFTYDGNEKILVNNVNPSQVEAINNVVTNAGEYTAVFKLKDATRMLWMDGTTEDKTFNWKINKAQGSISVSSDSVVLNGDNTSQIVTLTVVGDGAVTATSSDDSCVDVSKDGNTLTIYSVDNSTGNVIITITLSDGTNYFGDSVTINASAQFINIYGAEWDGTSTTVWTRTDAAAGFSDPVPYVAGASSYGSPFDNLMPWSGMTVSDRTGGTMVAIPKFYYKLTQSGSGIKVQIADGYVDGYSVSPAHLKRGSETADRDVVYIGRYHCSTSDYKSTTGVKPKVSITRSTARSGIHNLGSNIWQCDFAMRFTLWLLYIVEFANWNSQDKIGYGCSLTSSSTSAVFNMGYTDNMPYHTGTTQTSRTTYGGTQYRNIEGLWDNAYDWMDGCYYNGSGMNIIMNPSSFSDSTGGISIGTPSNGFPTAFSVKNVSGTFPTFIASAANNGSNSTYSCDDWYFNASYPCLYVGGNYNQNLYHGLFCVYYSGSSYSYADIGCRLQELP